MNRRYVAAGAVLALLAVAAGAFGSHALAARIPAERLGTFETAARYQMYHALALVLLGLGFDQLPPGRARLPARLFVAGTLVFCGSLYGLALGAPRWFGAVAPVGGLCFMGGWLVLAAAAFRS
jgi:uncharacterized membrane protein YgdD (TMEM256/DUF423 family)